MKLFRGRSCKAMVDICNVNKFNAFYSVQALGTLAVMLSMYVLVYLNGDWESIGSEWIDMLNSPADALKEKDNTIKEQKSAIKQREEQIRILQKQKDSLQNDLNTISLDSARKEGKTQKEIEHQKEIIQKAQERIKDLEERIASAKKMELNLSDHAYDYIHVLQETLKGKRLCFAGGTNKWQERLREIFPDASFIVGKNFNIQVLNQIDYIIINTKYVSHACVKRIINNKDAETKVININNMHIDSMCKEILQVL